jgi:hypothetical protein
MRCINRPLQQTTGRQVKVMSCRRVATRKRIKALCGALVFLWSCASLAVAEDGPDGDTLVGEWRTVLPLRGNPTPVIWQARADGHCSYQLEKSAAGAASIPCTWKVVGDMLHETSNGAPTSRAKVQWINSNEIILTIVDNGRPGEAGSKRRLTRQ